MGTTECRQPVRLEDGINRIGIDDGEANRVATIRVPYPGDPEQRRVLFERVVAYMERHGTYEGTSDSGSFRGTTPLGSFAGHYRSVAGSEVLEIVLTHKPWLVPVSMFEHEVRKFLAQV